MRALIPLVIGCCGGCLAGCLGDRCGDDQLLRGNTCISAADAAPRADGDRGVASGDGDAGEALGTECRRAGADSDCPGGASFCVILPGNTVGYCTYRDCTVDPNDCPDGYICLDLDKFEPGQPHACIRL